MISHTHPKSNNQTQNICFMSFCSVQDAVIFVDDNLDRLGIRASSRIRETVRCSLKELHSINQPRKNKCNISLTQSIAKSIA